MAGRAIRATAIAFGDEGSTETAAFDALVGSIEQEQIERYDALVLAAIAALRAGADAVFGAVGGPGEQAADAGTAFSAGTANASWRWVVLDERTGPRQSGDTRRRYIEPVIQRRLLRSRFRDGAYRFLLRHRGGHGKKLTRCQHYSQDQAACDLRKPSSPILVVASHPVTCSLIIQPCPHL